MLTVDSATYTSNLEAKFTNCVFNISGNFMFTDLRVKITFDNCTFNIGKTTSLLKVDYSTGTDGCVTSDLQGDIVIKNSVF